MFIAVVVVDELHDRHALRGGRSAGSGTGLSRNTETEVSTLDFNAELRRAGANARGRWGSLRFFVRRYHAGGDRRGDHGDVRARRHFCAVHHRLRSRSTNAAASLAEPSATHWLGCDFMGRDVYSRIIYGARISLAVSIGSMLPGFGIRGHDRPPVRLSARLVRPGHPTRP